MIIYWKFWIEVFQPDNWELIIEDFLNNTIGLY